MKKLVLFTIIIMLLSSFVLAQEQSWGTVKKDECINLIQTCANCTSINFTSVVNPDKIAIRTDLVTDKSGTEFNYSFCNTSIIGQYIVNGVGDVDGLNTVFAADFEVTQTGKETTINVTMALGIIIILAILISFGSFMIYYAEGPLKFVSLLATILLLVFGLNVAANMATDSNMSQTVINLLWLMYKMFLYGFFAIFFFVLAKMITLLKIRKNPPPRIDSPLKLVKARRKEKYAHKKW